MTTVPYINRPAPFPFGLPATIGSAVHVLDARADRAVYSDAGATVPVVDGSPVNAWVDGVAGLVIAPTGQVAPHWTRDNVGRAVIRGQGPNGDGLNIAFNAAFQPNSDVFTVFVAAKMDSDQIAPIVNFGNATNSTVEGWSLFTDSTLNTIEMRASDGVTAGRSSKRRSTGPVVSLKPAVFTLRLTGTQCLGAVNGNEADFTAGGFAGPYTPPINNTDVLQIFYGGSNRASGDLYRIAMYRGPMTQQQATEIARKLVAMYNIWEAPNYAPAVTNVSATSRLWSSGVDTYRIPAIAVNGSVTLVACEHRYGSAADSGHIEIETRSSTNSGATFAAAVVAASDGINCCRNPVLIPSAVPGKFHLLYCRQDNAITEANILAGIGSVTVFHRVTLDNGATWSAAVDITSQVKPVPSRWYATGPGAGLLLPSGRLVAPVNYTVVGRESCAGLCLISDNDGASWSYGNINSPDLNETAIARMPESGRLVTVSRMTQLVFNNFGIRNWSDDNGATWTANAYSEEFAGIGTQSALLYANGMLLHSRIAARNRSNINVWASDDEGATFPRRSRIYTGGSAYSSLAQLPNGKIACLFEEANYLHITLVTFDPIAAT